MRELRERKPSKQDSKETIERTKKISKPSPKKAAPPKT